MPGAVRSPSPPTPSRSTLPAPAASSASATATPPATNPTKPTNALPSTASAWPLSNPAANAARSEFRQTHRASNPPQRKSTRGEERRAHPDVNNPAELANPFYLRPERVDGSNLLFKSRYVLLEVWFPRFCRCIRFPEGTKDFQ